MVFKGGGNGVYYTSYVACYRQANVRHIGYMILYPRIFLLALGEKDFRYLDVYFGQCYIFMGRFRSIVGAAERHCVLS